MQHIRLQKTVVFDQFLKKPRFFSQSGVAWNKGQILKKSANFSRITGSSYLKGWQLRQPEMTPDPKRKLTRPNFHSQSRRRQIRPWPPSLSRFAKSNSLSIKETLQCHVVYPLSYLTVFICRVPWLSFFSYLARLLSNLAGPNFPSSPLIVLTSQLNVFTIPLLLARCCHRESIIIKKIPKY